MSDKFGEIAKNELLYERNEIDISGEMLDQSQTNSRINSEMAIYIQAVKGITACWSGKYKNMFFEGEGFENLEVIFQRHYLNLDGYARQQAIEMVGAKTTAEEITEKKKKKGLLGLLGF